MVAVKYWFQIAISLLLALVLGSTSAIAAERGSAVDELQQLLINLDGIITDFSQQITNGQGYLVEEAQGTLYLSKPYFRWEVSAPFPQIILANKQAIEVYDPDLEQVTQRDLDGALDQAPLALLTQSEMDLAEHFAVEALDMGDTRMRYVMRPKSEDALFNRLEMVFNGGDLDALLIFDHTGQQTYIRFINYQSAQVIQSSLFELEYPIGTDFVRG
jgi:outer membrane lipoprotein carrier protein